MNRKLLYLSAALFLAVPTLATAQIVDTDNDGVDDTNDDLCLDSPYNFFDGDGDGCIDPLAHARHIEYWDVNDLPFTYVVHEGGAPFIDVQEVTYVPGDEIDEVVAGFDIWSTVANATLSATFGGTTPDSTADGTDGIHQVTFRDPDFISLFGNTVIAVGLTTSFTEPSSFNGNPVRPGQIVDADMLFNPTRTFSADTSESAVEVRAVAVHEAGHLFGMNHSALPAATMFPALPAGDAALTLETDDRMLAYMSYPDPASIAGATSVAGTVFDGATGQPIPGAAVFALPAGTDQKVAVQFTLPDGTWQMAGLPAGDYDFFVAPLNGGSDVFGVVPGYINELVSATAQTLFVPDFYDDAEGTTEDPLLRTAVSLVDGSAATGIDVITNADEAAPIVVDVSPLDAAVDVDQGSVVLLRFSEPVAFSSVAGGAQQRFRVIREGTSGPEEIAGQLVAIGTRDVLVFTPEVALQFDTPHRVELDAGIEDDFGNATTTAFTSTFTVESAPPLSVESVSPFQVVGGSIVVFAGEGFDTNEMLDNVVTIGGTSAQVLNVSAGSLVARVPEGLPTGVTPVEISVPGQTPFTGLTVEVVNVVDTARATEVISVPLDGRPNQVTILPNASWAIAATGAGLQAVVTEGSSFAFGDVVSTQVASGLDGIAGGPDGLRAYAVSRGAGRLYVIDTDDGGDPAAPVASFLSPLLDFDMGATPLGIAVDPTGRTAWVPTLDRGVQIWDLNPQSLTSFEQIGQIEPDVLELAENLTFSRDGSRAYLLGDESLFVVNTATRALVNEVPIGATVTDVVEAPQGNLVYVTDADGQISVVPITASAPSQVIDADAALRSIAISPTGALGYAADRRDEQVAIVDLRDTEASFRTVIAEFETGEDPIDVIVTPDGSGVITISEGSQTLDVFGIGFGPLIDSIYPPYAKPGDLISVGGEGFGLWDSTLTGSGFFTDVDFAGTLVGPSAGTGNQASFFTSTGWARVPAGYDGGPIRLKVLDVPFARTVPSPGILDSNPGFVSTWTQAEIDDTAFFMGEAGVVQTVDPLSSSLAEGVDVHPLGDYVLVDDGSEVFVVDNRESSPTYLRVVRTFAIDASNPDNPQGWFGDTRAFTPDGKRIYTHNRRVLNYFDAELGSPTFGQQLGTVDFSLIDPTDQLFRFDGLRELNISPDGSLLFVGANPFESTAIVQLTGDNADRAVTTLDLLTGFTSGKFRFHPNGDWAWVVPQGGGPVSLVDLDPFSSNFGTVIDVLPEPVAGLGPQQIQDIAVSKDGTGFWAVTREGGLGGQWNLWWARFIDSPDDFAYERSQTIEIAAPTGQAQMELHPNGRRAVFIIPERRVAYVNLDGTFTPLDDQVEPFDQITDLTGLGLFRFSGQWSPDGKRFYGVEQTDTVLRNWDYSRAFVFGFSGVSGTSQTGVVGQELPVPVRVRAVFEGLDPIENAVVRVEVASGGGTIDGGLTERTFVTGADGLVSVKWTLGPNPGTNTLSFFSPGGGQTQFSATGVVAPESIPLAIAQILPLDATSNVSSTTAAQVVFSRAVDRSTVDNGSFVLRSGSTGNPVPAFFGFSDGDRRITLIPNEPLAAESTFFVEVPAGIADLDGNQLGAATTTSFVTAAPPAPSLGGITPPAGTVGSTIVVSGSGFDPVPANVAVALNGNPVTLTSTTVNSIRFKVPSGATTGPLAVSVNGQPAGSAPFTVLVPSTTPVDSVDDAVDLGVAAQALAVLPNGLKGYAVSTTSDQVLPVDLIALTNGDPIAVGEEPVGAVSDATGTFVYVANRASHSISVIETATDTVVDTILLTDAPEEIVASPTGDAVYVVSPSGQTVFVIDLDTSSATFNTVTAQFSTGQSTSGASISPDGGLLFLGTDDGFLTVGLEPADFGVTAQFSTGQSTSGASISPDGTLLILLTENDDILLVDIDGPGFGTVTAQFSTGQSTSGASISPDGTILYVIAEDTDEILAYAINVGGSVSVLEGIPILDLELLAVIDGGDDPSFIVFDPRDPTVAFVGATGDLRINVFGRTAPDPPSACEAFEVVFGTSWDPEPSLQEVLDAEYGVGALDAATDYEGFDCDDAAVPYWLDDSVDGWLIREVGDYASRNALGWYAEELTGPPVIDGVDDGVIFSGTSGVGSESFVGLDGPTRFGLYLNPNGGQDAINAPEPELFFTNRRYNDVGPDGSGIVHAPDGGDPQALIYDVTALRGGVPTYLIAWEDVDAGAEITSAYSPTGTDNDFNDLVIEVRANSPVSAVVSNLQVTAGERGVDVAWSVNGVPSVERVVVQRRADGDDFVEVARVDDDATNGRWTDRTLEDEGAYGYRVLVFLEGGWVTSEEVRISYAPPVIRETALTNAWPNPFNPKTTIEYALSKPGRVQLRIYNLAGRLVRAFDLGRQPIGYGQVEWTGRDDDGRGVASGVYLVKLVTPTATDALRVVLVK